jgi:hypothetical protein
VAYTTREGYLNAVVAHFTPDFAALGKPLPERLRVTCGWPSTGALAKARTIGECWYAPSSADGTVEIFISPYLADPVEVGETLVHELVHAAVGPGFGHKGPFKEFVLKLGMVGPMRSTRPGTELRRRLNVLSRELGPYPHARLNAHAQERKKQGTRLIQCVCPNCGYLARITKKWIKKGLPLCPCGEEFLVPAVTIEGEEEE